MGRRRGVSRNKSFYTVAIQCTGCAFLFRQSYPFFHELATTSFFNVLFVDGKNSSSCSFGLNVYLVSGLGFSCSCQISFDRVAGIL